MLHSIPQLSAESSAVPKTRVTVLNHATKPWTEDAA